jgi:long-chain acyl-CoA synthetase
MKSELDDPLLTAWANTLARAADRPAIFNVRGGVRRTFRDVEMRAQVLAAKLEPFDAGEVLAVQLGNHEDWPSILLACLRKRLVVLPLEQSMARQECEMALGICHAAAVVAPISGVAAATTETASAATGEISIRTLAHTSVDWPSHAPSLLKLTSGTTAAPRAIRFRSEQLLADCTQICDTMGIHEDDRNFAVIPVSHSYGFSNVITPLLARAVPIVLSDERMPRAVLEDLAHTGATVFPGMPIFYQAFSEMENVLNLPHLRLCISAGAPLPVAAARKFHEKFNQPIHSFYGSSECGGICYDRDGTIFEQGFVGSSMNGVKLEWLEPDALASRVRVRSVAVADGYFPEPEGKKLGGGCFVPDDLLSETPHGLRIVGRISDIINVAGKKVNPIEVEAELLRCAGVREAVVFGRPSSRRNEEVAACVVAAKEVRESDLLESCRRRLSGWQVPKRIFLIDQIPVNERGKFSRRELAQRFAAP